MDEKKIAEILKGIEEAANFLASLVGPIVDTVKNLANTMKVLGKSEEDIRATTASLIAGIEAKLAEIRATPWGRHPDDK